LARARAYMLAYLALDNEGDAFNSGNAVVKIEKMVKQFISHRCALDFDGGFIKSTVIYDD